MEPENLKLPEQAVFESNCPPNLADPFSCFAFGSHANWSSSSSSSTPNFSSCSSVGNSNPSYDIGMVSNSSTSTTSQKSSDIDQSNNIIRNLVTTDQSDHHSSTTHDHLSNNIMTSSNNINLVNDLLGFPNWNNSTTNPSSYDMQLAKIKEEFSESLPKFTDLLNSPSSGHIDDYGHFLLATHNSKDLFRSDSTTYHHPFMFKAFKINGRDDHDHNDQIPGAEYDGRRYSNNYNSTRRGQFSQIYPSVNISNLNNNNNALDNLEASARFMGRSVTTGHDHIASNDNISSLAVLRDHSNVRTSVANSIGFVQMQQPHDRLQYGLSNQVISSVNDEMIEIAKRSSSLTETKLMHSNLLTTPNKKSRSESRTSCPPFKVRKEKLGDRIAGLQQLVSPFGKTDTASVLMEAIGYIKFLQSQVETLSVPYMKSSRNKSAKTIQGGLKEEGSEEARQDLRSRGLCLVPLSCMSYVTGDHAVGNIWPPPNFGGST